MIIFSAFTSGILASFIGSYIYFSRKIQQNVFREEKNLDLEKQIKEQDEEIDSLEDIKISQIREIASLSAKLEQSQKQSEEITKKFTLEFENLANKIFDQKAKTFKEQSSENLSQILNPLNEKIKEFKQAFEDKIYKQSQEQISLKEEIKRITITNQEMTKVTENLTKALRGDSKAQGDWGEQVLETILENSGLQSGVSYHSQQNIKDESGNNQRPDIVISLPDGKKIIIDSKVSLTSYEKYISSEEEIPKQSHVSDFVLSIKTHIKGLSKKDYQKHLDGNPLDFVIMFMPIDATFFLAMQAENSLFNEALRQNVVIVSPTTLIPIIRTISQMWRVDDQIKNVSEITKKAASLYDKLFIFIEKFEKVGSKIIDAASGYEDAIKTLSQGNGNALRQAEELKKMGIPVSKNIAERKDSIGLISEKISNITTKSGSSESLNESEINKENLL